MELYIEKEFLEDFYIEFSDNSKHRIVKEMIVSYGAKRVFVNYKEEEFESLNSQNEFFALIANTTVPIPVSSIHDTVVKSDFQQTIVFTKENQDWFKDIESKGALCFCYANYEEKIQQIIEALHFKIDLSVPFRGWSVLESMKKINYNKIVVTDGYVLTDKSNQKMEDNIIPILKKLGVNDSEVIFFTKDLNPIVNTSEKIKEKAKKRVRKLHSVFANDKAKFKIINSTLIFDVDFHDRNIMTNFSLLDSGKGFNLLPHQVSNSQLISETIFDKYTYDRISRLSKFQLDYLTRLKNLETLEFKHYPS